MTIKCPKCHIDNLKTSTFCADCSTKLTDHDDYISDMIKQIFLTEPGERIKHSKFGCGLLQLVFEAASEELNAKIQLLIREDLKKYLGDLIEVIEIKVEREESRIQITLVYTVRRTQQHKYFVVELELND